MGNTLNSVHEYLQDDTSFEYIEQARKLAKNQRPRKGGTGFNQWGVSIIRKLKRGKVNHVSYRTLGACGQFFDTFFRPLLPEVKELTEELLKGGLVIPDELPFQKAKKILQSYKESSPKFIELKLVVMGETSPDSIKFQNQVEMQNRTAVITEQGSNKLAVIVGPLILLWEKNGLIVPRLTEPFTALCVLNLRSQVLLNTENLIKISEACCHFNKYYDYSPFLQMKQHNEASSHAFVWLLLKETLGLKEYWIPGGAIDRYLKNLLIADDMVNFKGFSFTTDVQIENYVKYHKPREVSKKEDLDFAELVKGFQVALDYRRLLKEEREKKRKKLEDFQKSLPQNFKDLTYESQY